MFGREIGDGGHPCYKNLPWGTWVAQSVKRPTHVKVTISQFMSSSPASCSVLTAQSLEPALDSVSPSLSAPPQLTLSLSLSKINIKKKSRGAWVAQLVKHLTSAQVMISRFMGSSPVLGSVLTARSLLGILSLSLSLSLSASPLFSLSLSLSQTNK